MSASVTAFLATFWAAHSDAIITVVVVPFAGYCFTRLTTFASSDKWDAFKARHPYWAAVIMWVRVYGPDASRRILAKKGVVLVDTNKPPPDPRIGTEVKGA